MIAETTHNPDRFISDLRLIMSQGRKRIGLLIGAGAPFAVRVDAKTGKVQNDGTPLIPAVDGLTQSVLGGLKGQEKIVVDGIVTELGLNANIEGVLSCIRLRASAIGNEKLHGLDGAGYENLGKSICKMIGTAVAASLPAGPNPYSEIVGWISGTARPFPIEIFTTNYDLLFEEAFERAAVPYFDGFSGGHSPFFDASSVSADEMPARWARLWKLHGSLGWGLEENKIVRGRGRAATELIYPDHLKYDRIRKLPYSSLFERLKQFLLTPDSLLIACGFSFSDAHICAVLDEALAANANTAVFAFQFRELKNESSSVALAQMRPNFSVYAADAAVVRGVSGVWQFGDAPNEDWEEIRRTFWGPRDLTGPSVLTLGDFSNFCRFIALSQATRVTEAITPAVQPKPETPEAIAVLA